MSTPPPNIVQQPKTSFTRWLLSPFIYMLLFITVTFLLLTFGRQWYDSLLKKRDHNQPVHQDTSLVTTGIRSEVKPSIVLLYQTREGKRIRVIADPEKYSHFVNQQFAFLEQHRESLLNRNREHLRQALKQIFDKLNAQAERYADWYFDYTTTYKVLWVASYSAASHLFESSSMELADIVAYDVEKYLRQHYEIIVLRPELTDPELQRTYKAVLSAAHEEYLNLLSQLESRFQNFVMQQSTHEDAIDNTQVYLKLDWESQFKKVSMADYEKGAQGAAVGAALAAGGGALGKSITGKTVAGLAGKGLASEAVAGAASKGLFSKLAAPFVSKAMLAGSGAAAGSLAGPIGIATGILGGLSVDYLISEGIELAQRDQFIADVHAALEETQKEWEDKLSVSLQQAIGIWLDDIIQLLPRYENK